MKRLIIYGTEYPDIVKLVESINRKSPEWDILGFIGDKRNNQQNYILGYPILGNGELIESLIKDENIYFFNSYCDCLNDFKDRVNRLEKFNCNIATLIHPSVDISHVNIGRGSLVEDSCCLGANVEIGEFVTIRSRCIVSHDVKVGDYVFIGPGATVGSHLTIQKEAFIGLGATILATKNLGQACKVGAGAVVVGNVPDKLTVVGVPARKIKKNHFKNYLRQIRNIFRKYISFI